MITIKNLSDSLPLIIQNDESFNRLKNDFSEILADLITFKSNPNCSCRNKVFKFFIDKLQTDNTLLNKYIIDEIDFNNKLTEIIQKREDSNISGRFFIVAKTQEAWTNFAQSIQNKSFRSFSVTDTADTLTVYFL